MGEIKYDENGLTTSGKYILFDKMTEINVVRLEDGIDVLWKSDAFNGNFAFTPASPDQYKFVKDFTIIARNKNKNIRVDSFLDNMMICPTCKKLVAINAISCPSCGYVFQQNQPVTQPVSQSQGSGGLGFWGTVLAIIVAIAIIGFIG